MRSPGDPKDGWPGWDLGNSTRTSAQLAQPVGAPLLGLFPTASIFQEPQFDHSDEAVMGVMVAARPLLHEN